MRELYARFSSIDEAEAAVRTLRQGCGGVRSFRIRRRRRLQEGESDLLPASAFAMLGTGAFSAPAAGMETGAGLGTGLNQGSYSGALLGAALLPDLASGEEERPAGEDGPAGREDCLLEVRVEDAQASRAEDLLRAAHGLQVFRAGEG